MGLREKIIESTQEIFTTMVMMEITALEENADPVDKLKEGITGLIGLAGAAKGIIAIHLPNKVAFAITSSFLSMDVNEINEDVEDAIGEIANMLGGDVKTALSENGRNIDISLPSTISGSDYEFQTAKNAERTIIKFRSDSGDFLVDLQMEK